jgi:AraC family transcriptional regulator
MEPDERDRYNQYAHMSAAVDRVVFASECVTIGAFRCAIDHPSFRDSGPIQQDCFVFPRTVVVIQHCDGRPFVADPTIVTLYNRNQHYARRPVSADGDRCDWFAVSNDILRGALLHRDPAAANDERPIRFAHAPADAATYLAQRRLFTDAAASGEADPLGVEERVVRLLDRVLARAYGDRRHAAVAEAARHATELADATKQWMAPRIGDRLTLPWIARAVGCSVFHLCRSFRRATGLTLHAYREQVRLRVALERLEGGERDLSRVALDLGYSSHSHFTAAFRRAFGEPPSAARRAIDRARASF